MGHGFSVGKYHQNWELPSELRNWAGPSVRPGSGFPDCLSQIRIAFLRLCCPDQNWESGFAMMPQRFVLEGIHKGSDRQLNLVIRNCQEYVPNSLLSIVKHMLAVQ